MSMPGVPALRALGGLLVADLENYEGGLEDRAALVEGIRQ